jgi:hypothetical protein
MDLRRCCSRRGEVGEAEIYRTDGVVITRQRDVGGYEMFINETRARRETLIKTLGGRGAGVVGGVGKSEC